MKKTILTFFRSTSVAWQAMVIWISVFLIGVASCSREPQYEETGDSDLIRINLFTEPYALGQAVEHETKIDQLKALVYVYDGVDYRFSYFASIDKIEYRNTTGYTYFTLKVFGESRPVKISIVANASDVVEAALPLSGESVEEIKPRIKKAFTQAGIAEKLPMWAEFLFPAGINASLNDMMMGTKALRALARVDIDATEVSSVFQMTSIRVYRANQLIQLIPSSFSTDPLKVELASIPSTSTQSVNTDPINLSQNSSFSQLYLPESEAPSQAQQITGATCVVVGGYYNNSSIPTYYRLDFAPPISGYPLGQILRNHLYTFRIKNVLGPGWPTPDDAANNVSSHLISTVLDWTDVYIHVNIEGRNHFFLSTKEVSLSGDVVSTKTVPIETDILLPTIYWSDASGNPVDSYQTFRTNIENPFFKVSITNVELRVQSLQRNGGGNPPREQYFTIAAGRLRVPIKITQEASLCATLVEVNPVGALTRAPNINVSTTPLQVLPVLDGGDLGILSYQWFRNAAANTTTGTLINGANTAQFTPPTNAVGTLFYYCVVTNPCDGSQRTSPLFSVVTSCPNLTGTLSSPLANNTTVFTGTTVTMTVSGVNAPLGSTIQYRWFVNSVLQNETGTAITRAVNGTTTFRCEATNGSCASSTQTITRTVNTTGTGANSSFVRFGRGTEVSPGNWMFGALNSLLFQLQANCAVGYRYRFQSGATFTITPASWSTELFFGTTPAPRVATASNGWATFDIFFDRPGVFEVRSMVRNDINGALTGSTVWRVVVE